MPMRIKKESRPDIVRKESAPLTAYGATSYAEHYAAGKALRSTCPRNSHSTWKAPSNRPDPVELVLESEKGRLAELLPLRHGRMAHSRLRLLPGFGPRHGQAIASFSVAYADRNEKDHAALARAIKQGKLKAVFEQEE